MADTAVLLGYPASKNFCPCLYNLQGFFFVKPKKPLPQVVCDAEKIAMKYTPQGTITVSLAPVPKGYITFAVKDTGIGISKETMKHLFKKFSRGEGSFTIKTPKVWGEGKTQKAPL